MLPKKAIVVHSGGMDSSLCLKLALDEFGKDQVLSLSFNYHQRHSNEIKQAAKIAAYFDVEHRVLDLAFLNQITENALMNKTEKIEKKSNELPNTLVIGRNGLMARIAAIYAYKLNASCIFMGVIEVEGSNSGYLDCNRAYIDLLEKTLRIDLNNPEFSIRTPLVYMTKKETMELGSRLGVLDYLLEETITCYEGISKEGCLKCPACVLRNEGLRQYREELV